MPSPRYEKGLDRILEHHGDVARNFIDNLQDIAPDMAKFTVEYAYGDIYTREGLDMKSRAVATLASIATMGGAENQLRSHIKGALNLGLSREEIVEVFMHLSVYAGFPRALNAIYAAKDVFAELDEKNE